MGFEGQLFQGTAGSTATDNLTNVKDISITYDTEKGDTTVRGTSATPPIKTEAATLRIFSVEWGMINDSSDDFLALIMTAVTDATLTAIKLKDFSSGKGPDFDAVITLSHAQPLQGEQIISFTAVPSVVRNIYH